MLELGFIGCGLFAWVMAYRILSRVLFRSRSGQWERFEDMTNEGCQTSLLLIASGMFGAITTAVLFVSSQRQ